MSLVNVSEGASLALHGMALIARQQPQRLSVKYLAEKLHASQAHLAKVFQKLSKAKLVKSERGPTGGFQLNKPADQITFWDIFRVIDGDKELGECPFGKEYCAFHTCIFSKELNRISQDIYETFNKMKLSDFVGS